MDKQNISSSFSDYDKLSTSSTVNFKALTVDTSSITATHHGGEKRHHAPIESELESIIKGLKGEKDAGDSSKALSEAPDSKRLRVMESLTEKELSKSDGVAKALGGAGVAEEDSTDLSLNDQIKPSTLDDRSKSVEVSPRFCDSKQISPMNVKPQATSFVDPAQAGHAAELQRVGVAEDERGLIQTRTSAFDRPRLN